MLVLLASAAGVLLVFGLGLLIVGEDGRGRVRSKLAADTRQVLVRYLPGYEERLIERAYEQGRNDAMTVLDDEQLVVRIAGYVPPWHGEYTEVMKRKYNIKIDYVSGCVVTTHLIHYNRGYNDVMIDVIRKRYGADILEAVAIEIQQEYEVEPE